MNVCGILGTYLMNLLIVFLVEATPQPTSNELMKCELQRSIFTVITNNINL